MSHEGFLREICEHPDNDAPRLIYADWLEEQGESARAAFIRMQIEQARLPDGDPRKEYLSKELSKAHRVDMDRWREQLARLSGVRWQRFWRGFVSGATFDHWKHFRDLADRAFATTPIQFLKISHLKGSQCYDLVQSPHLHQFLGLNLTGSTLTDAGVGLLATCPSLVNLRRLGLSCEQEARFGPSRPPSFGDAGANALAKSPYLEHLRFLGVVNNALSESATRALLDRFGDRVQVGMY